MATTTPQYLSKQSQEGIIQYHKRAYEMMMQQWNFREQMRTIDLAYQREQDWTDIVGCCLPLGFVLVWLV